MQRRLTRSWLIRSPHKYPFIPNMPIPNHTPEIRTARPHKLFAKELFALPSPLRMLSRVVFIYRNGQIHASVRIKSPARVLPKRIRPASEPKSKNVIPHIEPSPKPKKMTRRLSPFRRSKSSSACISATVGSSIVETELVSAVGNKMHGNAIPVSTP